MALPSSSLGLSTGYRANLWFSTARAAAFYLRWRVHGKCHGYGHGTCRVSVRCNLSGTNHGNRRKYNGNSHDIFHGHHHAVGIALGLSAVSRLAVVRRECFPYITVEIAVEIAIEIAVEFAVEVPIASAIGLDGVLLLAAVFCGGPCNLRGSP